MLWESSWHNLVRTDGAKNFLVSFLPLHSCISGEGTIVTDMTQVYSTCCQTQCAVRFVYWDYILSGLLWKITESLYFSMYTFGFNKPLSNTVLPPLHDSCHIKFSCLTLFSEPTWFYPHRWGRLRQAENFCNMFYTHLLACMPFLKLGSAVVQKKKTKTKQTCLRKKNFCKCPF